MYSLSKKIKKQKSTISYLSISYLLITLIIAFFGIFTIKGLYDIGDLTKRIYEHPLVVSNASLYAALNITKMHLSMKDAALANSSSEMALALKDVAENEQHVYRQLELVQTHIIGEEGKALEKQTRQLFEDWKPIRENVVRLLQSGNQKEAIVITKTNGAAHADKLELAMLALTSYARAKADSFIELAKLMQSALEKFTLVLSVLGVFISVIIAFFSVKFVANADKILLEASKKLEEQTQQDELTKVANRRHFDQKLQEEWGRMRREKKPLSLIFFDIDHFKRYNDSYGHLAGDDCLQTIASTALPLFKRPGDFFARFGGEEFIVILTNTSFEGATFLAEELRRHIYEAEMHHEASPVSKFVTISCGVSSITPDESASYQALLKVADEALYEAKEQGRNKTVSRNMN